MLLSDLGISPPKKDKDPCADLSEREWGQVQEELFSNITHDLRAPLCAIMGYLDLVGRQVDKSDTPKAQEYLSLARQAGQRLNDMVSDILDMLRFENDRSLLQFKTTSIESLFHTIRKTFAGPADLQGLRLHFLSAEKNLTVWSDVRYIERVFDNLVANAIKFTPAGGSIRISARVTLGRMFFEVADTGRGIPPEDQTRIFEKFQQVRSVDRTHGYGMGLAVAKAVVEAHRGRIWVESELGKGSHFIFWIPAVSTPGHSLHRLCQPA